MSEKRIYIDSQKCTRCGVCVQTCPVGAITERPDGMSIDEDQCTLCGLCESSCEAHAITIMRRRAGVAETRHRDVWVFIEHRDGVHLPCLQVASKAAELAARLGERLVAIVVGKPPFDSASVTRAFDGIAVDEVRLLGCETLAEYYPEDVVDVLEKEIVDGLPRYMLFLGSLFGRALAPRLAARLETGLTADCTELSVDEEGNLVQVRPTYGGRILASILCRSSYPQMATVRPGVFEVRRTDGLRHAPRVIEKLRDIDSIQRVKKVIETTPLSRCGTPIEEAEVIVCGGLGVGSKDGFGLLETLAEKIGGVVAGTREVVDRGWLPGTQQIGQTGKTVRPRLYIGVGVSGAIHHMIGMKHSRSIVAINSDPRAPIFRIATVGIVDDLFEAIPDLMRRL